MNIRSHIRTTIRRFTGLYVYRTPPRGTDFYADCKCAFPKSEPRIVFDVGANEGQSTKEFLFNFPKSTIHAFEPIPATAAIFQRRFANNDRVILNRFALSEKIGTAAVNLAEKSVSCSIGEVRAQNNITEDLVRTDTVDSYRLNNNITRIDFMKIDTEGHDFAVLRGAFKSLQAQAIEIFQVEAGMSPDNTFHCNFENMKSFVEPFGYRLFGIYEQVREFPNGKQYLRRVNAVFILK